MDGGAGGQELMLPWPEDAERAAQAEDDAPSEDSRLAQMEVINREGAAWATSAAEVCAAACICSLSTLAIAARCRGRAAAALARIFGLPTRSA